MAIGIPLAVVSLIIIVGAGAYKIYKHKNKVSQIKDIYPNNGYERSKMTGHSALMHDQEDNGMLPMNSE